MVKVKRIVGRVLLVLGALIALGVARIGCEYFPESTFELANESRLPKWFTLPPGSARLDLSVTMNYYVMPWGPDATFVLHDRNGKVLAKVSGKVQGGGALGSKGLPQSDGLAYPCYEIITVNGTAEVIEHRKMEPTFYITDDAPFHKK